jgi:LacI family transcriptional regulator
MRRGGGRSGRTTRKDVADLAGVSTTTVSFVLNETTGQTISEATRQRVLDAVAALGYRPNRAAQGLRKGRTANVGFLTLDLDFGAYGAASLVGAQAAAGDQQNHLLVLNTPGERDPIEFAVKDLIDHPIDALVVAVAGTRRVWLPDAINHVPTVLSNCFVAADTLPSVLPDEVGGGRDATQVLVDHGHTQFAYLTGYSAAWATRQRLRGFRQALAAAGINAKSQTVLEGNFHVDSGYELAKRVLRRKTRPTALMCGNDRMAIGAYIAILEAGLRVPQDISVMGYDGQDSAAEVHPGLSTVRLPYYEMGEWATRKVLTEDVNRLPGRTLLRCPLVPRASVARPPAALVG